ncbi:unnamed protein product [Alternaria alternata]
MLHNIKDWNNRTLNASSISSEASGLLCQALFVDEHETIYSFGGQLSANGQVKDTQPNSFYDDRLPEIWALPLANPKAPRSWSKVVGKNAAKPMPPDFQQLACGAYAYDLDKAYYAGGFISYWTTFQISNITQNFGVPGLVEFDFSTKHLTNSTNDGQFFASRFTGVKEARYRPGPIFNIPFGPQEGVLLSFGGLTFPNATDNEYGAGWSNLWIYDKGKKVSYHQSTTGDVPELGINPETLTFWSETDEKNETFEM